MLIKSAVLFTALSGLLLSGCASRLDTTTRLPGLSMAEETETKVARGTLFPSDEAVLGGANIEEILKSKLVIPKPARLAVLQFGRRHNWGWLSEGLSEAEQNLEKGALTRLRACAGVTNVSQVPLLMVPEKQSIPYLREAAARLQADLLLVYR